MAFKLRGTATGNHSKVYLQPVAAAAAGGSRQWEYVSADTNLVVEACGYIVTTTADGQLAYDMLRVGDLIWVYTVASILDTRDIEADKATGITDIGLHAVLRKDSDVVELSADMLGATVSYTNAS